jgi:hypothetical protein
MRKLFDRRFLLFGQADPYNLISALGRVLSSASFHAQS